MLVSALADAMRLDAVVHVRRAAMDVVAHFASRSSVLRDALRASATSEANAELRQRALTHLQAL